MMSSKNKKTLLVGLTVAIIFVILGVFCFSYAMETLDVKAEELGAEEQPVYEPPLPDYTIPGLENEWGALLLGITSTLLLFGVGLGAAVLLKKKK
ncbi:MAG: cobalamin biosynthesis protein CbiN [Candidatus Bathyarchaeota archaeon]|nr:cobalamin biosynthesis protein CbiN [Candidatus Bathyarchaeota archaeon]